MKNLKNLSKLAFLLLLTVFVNQVNAQKVKPTVIILDVESKGLTLDAQQMGNMLRTEVEKLDTFDVTDKYDVAYLIEKNKLNVSNCYGKTCLLEIAKVIKTDYMITGSTELINQKILITLRLINVEKQSIEKTTIEEFNNLPLEIQSMVKITTNKMFNRKNDIEIYDRLTKKFDYENAINNPTKTKVNLEGPRFGYVFVFGRDNETLRKSKIDGGYDVNPAFFQFGYQFEKQYLNEGNFQALFEFIPMITGVDQQLVIPNIAILNGFRNNKNGWEFAFGPTFSIVKKMEGAKRISNGKFTSKSELIKESTPDYIGNFETKMDSRGDAEITTALIIAFGKTLKSGKLNIPINIWGVIPNSDGFRVGVSFGYNTKP
ncbi:MAG: hypothetical protein ACOYMA_12205 [Bacteroidia bacterium]